MELGIRVKNIIRSKTREVQVEAFVACIWLEA
jgi:hypothetical protein